MWMKLAPQIGQMDIVKIGRSGNVDLVQAHACLLLLPHVGIINFLLRCVGVPESPLRPFRRHDTPRDVHLFGFGLKCGSRHRVP